MRPLTVNEVLNINRFLQMETNSLAMSKAGVNAIEDQQLSTFAKAGINAAEERIKCLQQFVVENNVVTTAYKYPTEDGNQVRPNNTLNPYINYLLCIDYNF